MDVAYAGSLGRNLQWQRNINSIGLGANFLASSLDASQPGRPLPANFLRPIPGYGPLNYVVMASSSNYQSLQVIARRRFARNFQFGAAWMWSKAMDFNDTDQSAVTTIVNLRGWHHGVAGYDRTHTLSCGWRSSLRHASVRLPGASRTK